MDMFQVRMIRMSLICDSLMHIKQPAYHEWAKKHIIKSKGIPVLFQGSAYGALTLWRRLFECDEGLE